MAAAKRCAFWSMKPLALSVPSICRLCRMSAVPNVNPGCRKATFQNIDFQKKLLHLNI